MTPGGIKRISTLFRPKSSKDSKPGRSKLQPLPDSPESPSPTPPFSSSSATSTFSRPGTAGSTTTTRRKKDKDKRHEEDLLGPASPLDEFAQPLTDRVVVVSGASRGIGLEFVKQLSQDPHTLVIALIRNPETAAKLVQLTSTQVVAIHADVTDEASLRAAASDVSKLAKGKVDMLINCAAVNTDPDKTLEEWDAEGLNLHLATNVTGPVLTTNAFLPLLRHSSQKPKKIINLTSGMASLTLNSPANPPSPSYAAYTISKCCLNAATRKYAVELGREGMLFVALSAGWVRTDMGGPDAPLSAQEAVSQLLRVIEGLKQEDNGKFLHINGEEIDF
ncbi:NADP-binding protein [Dacryopinax primogenitus]|uniref:NADP-binding protein n=1 Tax=Dacryopinax primogenitus (strain DJM 731) TaxID=1858805 RepID=M5G6R5_DACPD|nr:NADP-binding protein [Dacryopinax primogenitus]EJU05946.1 NADP-binding protein [Dacryopinax primogenitus]